MTSYFITNKSGKTLKEYVHDIMINSESVDALVGYFYWSGFSSICHSLNGKKLRILVGMDIDPAINTYTNEKFFESKLQSQHSVHADFLNKEKKRITESIELENPESQNGYEIYLQMLKEGRLEIRRTKEPNHAKLYIFQNSENLTLSHGKGQVITGSSNLTRSGLEGRAEINVLLKDDHQYKESTEIFEDLWAQSIPILNHNNIEEYEEVVVKQTFLSAKPSPFEFYLRTLIELFDVSKEEIKSPSQITAEGGKQFDDLEYQLDAIKEGIKKINTHNGVIIADVVGLGKSIIASTIAHNLKLKTVIIAPPHLKTQWEEYSKDFDIKSQNSIYSSGKIEQAYHDLIIKRSGTSKKLIIIDEAHKYRNENTDDHKYLMDICRGNYVVLLTATPYNNSPQDLKALLRLFQIEGSPTIQSLNNIFDRFAQLQIDYKKLKDELKKDPTSKKDGEFSKIARELKSIIEPVLIRRSRLDITHIKKYSRQIGSKINFSKVRPPEVIEYQLGEWEQKYISTLQKIAPKDGQKYDSITEIKKGFKGVRYNPAAYIKNWDTRKKEFEEIFGDFALAKTAGTNLAKMMKDLLIRRFESSVEAFRSSLKNSISTHKELLKWYDRGYVPIYKKGNLKAINDYLDEDDDGEDVFGSSKDLSQQNIQTLKNMGIELIPAENFLKRAEINYRVDLEKDMKLLQSILKDWEDEDGLFEANDPKLGRVYAQIKELQSQDPSRKILIYSSYADTVNYVYKRLKAKGLKVLSYSSKESRDTLKIVLRKNFDAGLPVEEQEDDYDILVATDAISEGYNLHRAGVLINYDIPYNPTRVIQRLGRINRINRKVFDELYIYNFFPTFVGKQEGLRIEELATLKMSMIHSILGEDSMVLKSDETAELQTFLQEQFKETDSEETIENWEVVHRNVLEQFRDTPEFERAKEIPDKTRIGRVIEGVRQDLVFVRKNKNMYFNKLVGTKLEPISIQDALSYIQAAHTDIQSYAVSEEFKKSYFASIPTFYSSDNQSRTAAKFSRPVEVSKKESNSNWSRAENYIMYLKKETHTNEDELVYLDQLLEIIRDYKALSQQDLKALVELGKKDKGIPSIQELIPTQTVERIAHLCRDVINEPKTVVLIQEIQPDSRSFIHRPEHNNIQ